MAKILLKHHSQRKNIMISQAKIQEIITKIVAGYNPDKVILFGSYAQGNSSENSDVDVIVVKETSVPKHRRGREVQKLLRGGMIPVDVLVYNQREIDEWKNVKSSFIHEVLKTGKVVYERPN